ncbi:hypothetical protein [Pseudomonas fragi]|uniref:hypothetical protein n=1 Tax=Pseudomonas fragi TaxID=296 RepID=UPI001F19243A|nr:hypothetical protein [Pseudomonas fragi]MCF6763814.1 hypothetical protein [Pseudomonas fragi]
MSIPSDYTDIIFDLLQATKDSRVNWQNENHTIVVRLPKTRVKLWSGTDEETNLPFVSFALTDVSGRNLDSWAVDEGDPDFDTMHTLYSLSRRIAFGIPERLKDLRYLLATSSTIGEEEEDIPF